MTGLAAPAAPPSRRARLAARLRGHALGVACLLVILAMALAAVLAPWVSPYDPVAADFAAILSPPSAAHWLGTDTYGRDILSRLIWGTRTAFVVGLASSFLGCTAGAVIGCLSAYFGGRFDLVLQRVVDVMLGIPIIVTSLVAVSVLGRHRGAGVDVALIAAIAIPVIPSVTRVMRAAALSIRGLPYIDAARAQGFGHARIVLRHMLPNLVAPYLVLATAFIGQAILLEAALAFLGLGTAEPQPDWGLMLAGDAADFYREAPWIILFPGLAISVTVFAFNLFGDSLRDWLDPRRRG